MLLSGLETPRLWLADAVDGLEDEVDDMTEYQHFLECYDVNNTTQINRSKRLLLQS